MIGHRSLSGREALIAAGVALVATAAVFGWYVAHGGLASDDWYFLRAERAPAPRLGAGGSMWDPSRPLLGVYFLVLYASLGDHAAALLGVAAVLTGLVSLLLFVLLRLVGAPGLPAALVALLVLISPLADSATLWITGSQGHAALVLLLAGAIVAVLGLRRGAPLVWHVPALGLYAASILLYEVGALLPFASVLLYLLVAPRRDAVRRWALDVVVAGAATIYNAAHGTKSAGSGVSVDHVLDVVHGMVTMTQRSLQPALTITPVGGLVVLAAAATIALSVRRRPDLRPAAALATAGLVVAVLSWLVLAFNERYVPIDVMVGNRVNTAAALGIPMIAVAVGWAIVLLVPRPAAGYAVAALLLGLIAAHELAGLRADQREWAWTAQARREVVAAVDRHAPGRTPVVVRGAVTSRELGVPGLGSEELRTLLGARRGNADIPALVEDAQTRWRCDARGAVDEATGWRLDYGDAVVVDVPRDTAWTVDADSCRAQLSD